jgi:hypothetical protein
VRQARLGPAARAAIEEATGLVDADRPSGEVGRLAPVRQGRMIVAMGKSAMKLYFSRNYNPPRGGRGCVS